MQTSPFLPLVHDCYVPATAGIRRRLISPVADATNFPIHVHAFGISRDVNEILIAVISSKRNLAIANRSR